MERDRVGRPDLLSARSLFQLAVMAVLASSFCAASLRAAGSDWEGDLAEGIPCLLSDVDEDDIRCLQSPIPNVGLRGSSIAPLINGRQSIALAPL
jgi:hypothetical protein